MSTTAKVVILVAVVAIPVLAIWGVSQIRIEAPTFTVSAVSLNPNEISVGDFATFTFTIKNNDAESPHSVKVVFNTTAPVTFYENNTSLARDKDEFQYLPITLQTSEQSTYPLRVNAKPGPGASTSTYPIGIQFYDENMTRFDTETVSLKVNQ